MTTITNVAPAPAVLWSKVIPAPICAMLADLYRRDEPQQAHRVGGYGPPCVRLDLTDWGVMLEHLVVSVGQQFGLPVGYVDPAIIGYTAGMSFSEHTDYVEKLPSTHDRTVSFSALVTEPGRDFTGGEFVANGQSVDLQLGGMVGFTAQTPHLVRRVTSGQRLCLIGFGHANGPSDESEPT